MNSTSSPPSGIRVTGINKSFGQGESRTRVLKDTALEVPMGKMTFLIGPSGCGKTTLLSIVAGTMQADAGQIDLLGQRLHEMKSSQVTKFRARHIGFIFQQFNLLPTLTTAENVSVPLLIQGVAPARAEKKAEEALAWVGLADKARVRPNKLSGGQQQRVAIARALIHEPDVIICDEPTSALDSANGQLVMGLLRRAASEQRRIVLIVTHDNRIYKFADAMAEMEDGRITAWLPDPETIARHHPH